MPPCLVLLAEAKTNRDKPALCHIKIKEGCGKDYQKKKKNTAGFREAAQTYFSMFLKELNQSRNS